MRSSGELIALLLAALIGTFLATSALAADGTAPTDEQIERAIEAVKADPDMATHRTVRQLTWDDADKPRKSGKLPSWLSWIGDLFSWIGQASQMLVWLLLAVLAGLLVLFLVRLFAGARLGGGGTRFVAPTHVQDLDIRPESLPDDIGAAARALWDRGEHRAALALLYRGLLSRLAHVYEVPIKDSSTEGDCLRLAALTLDARRTGYATRLVRTWQRAIYGGLTVETAVVHELCDGFDAHLERARAGDEADAARVAAGAA